MKIVRQVEFSWAYLDKQKAIKMRNEKTNEENLKLHLKQRIVSRKISRAKSNQANLSSATSTCTCRVNTSTVYTHTPSKLDCPQSST